MTLTVDLRNPTPSHCTLAVFINGGLSGELLLRREDIDEFLALLKRGRQKGDRIRITGSAEIPLPDRRQPNLFDEPLPD